MAIFVYALDGMTEARATELGATIKPSHLPAPWAPDPCVALYSDVLNQWSQLYADDALQLVGDEWDTDPLHAMDTAETNRLALLVKLDDAITANSAGTPTLAELAAQVQAIARLFRPALDSQAGT